MKKLIIIFFMFLLLVPCFLIAAELTDPEIVEIIKDAKTSVIGINDVGFWIWFKANWWFFILAIVGIGRLIVFITPTKEDDLWYEKWILSPLRYIGGILSLNIPKKTSKKK